MISIFTHKRAESAASNRVLRDAAGATCMPLRHKQISLRYDQPMRLETMR
ncbi:MAG: hypothetical protein AAF358_01945 [Pseudomonadota bacterium]